MPLVGCSRRGARMQRRGGYKGGGGYKVTVTAFFAADHVALGVEVARRWA